MSAGISNHLAAFEGLKVLRLELVADAEGAPYVSLERAPRAGGQDQWTIRRTFGGVLGKTGIFEYEPRPAGRSDEHLANCRFDTVAEALEAWRTHLRAFAGDDYREFTVSGLGADPE